MDFWDELDSSVQGVIIAAVVMAIVLGVGLGLYRAFAVPYENARRDAYEHTESYVQGAVRDLGNLCLEIDKADGGHRALLQDTIRERYVKLDEQDVPAYLRPCLSAARKGNQE